MKKNFLKIISLILILATVFSLSACGEPQEEWVEGTNFQNSGKLYDKARVEKQKTGYKLIKRGVTEYKILLSENATVLEKMASSELSYFLKEATGATLNVVTQVEEGQPVISIGKTALANQLGVSVPAGEDLATSGYMIKTIGKNVFILSNPNKDGEGCLYGVYDFLYDAVGFECFAEDEFYFEKKKDVEVYDYDDLVRPSFDQRSIGYRSTVTDMTYQRRMRIIYQYTDARWGISGHNQAGDNSWSILRHDKYSVGHETCSVGDPERCSKGHPEWFTGSGSQLCWTAGDEMETEFAKNLFDQILKNPDGEYFHFGQEDNNVFCTCDRCTQTLKDYAGNVEGLQIMFANGVVEKTRKLVENDDRTKGRDIKYMIYAYSGTIDAPVVKQEDGTFKPYSDKVIPDKDLYIWFTPISTDFTKPLTHSNNLTVYDSLQGFNTLCAGRILVYIYDINFYNYLINFNNFGTVKGMYEEYMKNGVYYLYTQGPTDAVVPTFQEMRIYVESKLMWDVNQEYDDLVRKFMDNYFRDGASAMYNYYTQIRNRYAYYQGVVESNIGSIYSDIGNSEIWTEPVVSALGDCIDQALQAIEHLKSEDVDLYEKIKNRIMKENVSVLYLKLSHHSSFYSNEQIEQMKADFKYYTNLFGINATREGGSLDGLFD
ncbi:MAG: DUF4838 domain-containing protein [Clostridia bacterium]|nr:DUF4838 domain-containing protein [Clostridia bacterium]